MGVWVLIATLNDFVRSSFFVFFAQTFDSVRIPQINFVVWHDDAENRAPVWCDISVKVSFSRLAFPRKELMWLQ